MVNQLERARALIGSTKPKELSERVLERAKLNLNQGLDVYVYFDTTGSMVPYIQAVRENINKVGSKILEESSIRLSINGFGDYCDGANVLQMYSPTRMLSEIQGSIDSIVDTNGGDTPEAYEYAASELNKRIANEHNQSAAVFIGDSVPHGMLDQPERGLDYRKVFQTLHSLCTAFYFVGCNPNYYENQNELIDPNKGKLIPLGSMVDTLPELLIALVKKTKSHLLLEQFLSGLEIKKANQIRLLLQ